MVVVDGGSSSGSECSSGVDGIDGGDVDGGSSFDVVVGVGGGSECSSGVGGGDVDGGVGVGDVDGGSSSSSECSSGVGDGNGGGGVDDACPIFICLQSGDVFANSQTRASDNCVIQ